MRVTQNTNVNFKAKGNIQVSKNWDIPSTVMENIHAKIRKLNADVIAIQDGTPGLKLSEKGEYVIHYPLTISIQKGSKTTNYNRIQSQNLSEPTNMKYNPYNFLDMFLDKQLNKAKKPAKKSLELSGRSAGKKLLA